MAVVLDRVLAVVLEGGAEIERLDRDPVVVPRTECPVGVAVDGGAEDEAALPLEERRHVGAASGEGDPQGSPGSEQRLDAGRALSAFTRDRELRVHHASARRCGSAGSAGFRR